MAKSSGRPVAATDPADKELRSLVRQHGPAIIAELLRLGTEAKSESVKVAALRELLGRGYGRVPAAAANIDNQTVCYLIIDDGYDA